MKYKKIKINTIGDARYQQAQQQQQKLLFWGLLELKPMAYNQLRSPKISLDVGIHVQES